MAQEVLRNCDYPVDKQGTACGERVPNDKPTTFTLRDDQFETDLCEQHIETLDACLQPFIGVSRAVRRGSTLHTVLRGKRGTFTTSDVRQWLREQGKDVAPSGRLPEQFIQDYVAAHSTK